MDVTPSASRLTRSLRDLGYDTTTALAELVDNAVSAGADTISLDFVFEGEHSHITVTDNGHGMTPTGVDEALRFGSRRDYSGHDLGRFGLGLKTASLSQCQKVSVISRHAPKQRRIIARTLDLEHVTQTDKWQIYTPEHLSLPGDVEAPLDDGPGTVIVLQALDRVFEGVDPEGGWARRRLEKVAAEVVSYFGMVFHRFIEGTAGEHPVTMLVNGEKIPAWNPFAPTEEGTQELDPLRVNVEWGGVAHTVVARPYILPPRSEFSSMSEFERMGGPKRWNRQQGFYIYRSDRMVQSGGWAGLRGLDEHTKLARIALDFPRSVDELFRVNVPKMRVGIPGEIRDVLTRRVNEVCVLADARYRRQTDDEARQVRSPENRKSKDLRTVGLAIESAAIQLGELDTLDRIMDHVRHSDPDLADALGY